MLEMKNVSYSYKKRGMPDVLVFENASYQFKKGQTYALFGPSGAGKTTCLMLLGGLDTPDKGGILIDGSDIRKIGYNKLRRTQISYVFQDYQLFPYMTALENVMVASDILQKKLNKRERKRHCLELLGYLGITEREMNRIVTKLSGGQQQRVAIARALVNDPDYILADEPTGNLDKKNTRNIMELLNQIAHEKNKCIVIVTHSDYIRNACDVRYRLGQEETDECSKADSD